MRKPAKRSSELPDSWGRGEQDRVCGSHRPKEGNQLTGEAEAFLALALGGIYHKGPAPYIPELVKMS